MAAIATASRACLQCFASLLASLEKCQPVHQESMQSGAIENERGRFRIWIGNLGGLQKGRSSLDFRLRESVVMRSNVLKLLDQLMETLDRSLEVVDGVRLPWEQQPARDPQSDSDDDVSDSSDDDPSLNSNQMTRTELGLHLSTIVAVIADLYKLSFKIRAPTSRTIPLKATLYKKIDTETDVDVFSTYSIYDRFHVEESLRQTRKGHLSSQSDVRLEYQFLTDRLSRAITNRRRYFRYWSRHARKLADLDADSAFMEKRFLPQPTKLTKDILNPTKPAVDRKVHSTTSNPSLSTASRTILSGTEATEYDRKFDNQVETNSNISYATTAYDLNGDAVNLPPAPSLLAMQAEFTCLYCCVVCPARHAKGKSWRAHILQDLQPYICTYPNCPEPDHMYASRHAWLEHERLVHRKVWQCFEHPGTFFASKEDLQHHLKQSHGYLTEQQVLNLAELAESTFEDERQLCPFCFASGPFSRGLGQHMAFHQEKFAAFSVPKGLEVDEQNSTLAIGSRMAGVGSQDSLDSISLSFASLSASSKMQESMEDIGQASQMAPPSINVEFAPPSKNTWFSPPESTADMDSLSPLSMRSRKSTNSDPYDHPASQSRPTFLSSVEPGAQTSPQSLSLFDSAGQQPQSNPGSPEPPTIRSGRQVSESSLDTQNYLFGLADDQKRVQKHPGTFQCHLCPKRFTWAYNLRSHLRTHTEERPFVCTVCGKAFARQHDRRRHEGLHDGKKKFVCRGDLCRGGHWGCGRRFARADALGRHLRSEAGQICIKPLLDEESQERDRALIDQQQQPLQAHLQPNLQPLIVPGRHAGNFVLPVALIAQYPALQTLQWDQIPANADDPGDTGGRSSFDASSGGEFGFDDDDSGISSVSGRSNRYPSNQGNIYGQDQMFGIPDESGYLGTE